MSQLATQEDRLVFLVRMEVERGSVSRSSEVG